MEDFAMKKKLLMIYNSTAGIGLGQDKLWDLIQLLSLEGYSITVCPVVPDKELFTEQYIGPDSSQYDLILVCGGDGTLNHAINAMMRYGINVPVSFFPVGSTNDFAFSIYGTRSLSTERVTELICQDHRFAYDLGKMNDRYFNYVAAFGAFTDVSYTTPQPMKNALGHTAYILNLISSIPNNLTKRSHITVDIDGYHLDDDFLVGIISNTMSVGGVSASYFAQSELSDGLFELILVSAPNNLADLSDIASEALSGTADNRHIHVHQFRHLELHFSEPAAWTLDGEDGGSHSDVVIDVVPKAVEILAPGEESSAQIPIL